MVKSLKPQLDPERVIRAAEYVRMSTDHQKYSILNQSALIHVFAETNRMEIVATYADPGKSGLTLRSRPGLSRLLSDIVAGKVDFEVVLVYDVSRWGRFQDADESAHYEFLCRQAGIRVIYCAEQFGADGHPLASVLKALKRAMAGEFSRELSVKVAAGKARIASLGYRVGGIAGYGLRRQVLEDGQARGMLLRKGQLKYLQTDRVTLVPGPAEEVAVVARIYRDYIYLRKGELQIARALNAEGYSFFGKAWSRHLVRTILTNEKYIGVNILGRTIQRLAAPNINNPPEKWTRFEGAFVPIVSRDLFEAAARVRSFNVKAYTDAELLEALRVALKREGKLTVEIIERDPDLPAASTIRAHFGGVTGAYQRLGFAIGSRYRFYDIERALAAVRKQTQESLMQALEARSIECSVTAPNLIAFADRFAIEVRVCRHREPISYRCSGWRMAHEPASGSSHVLAIRMARGNQAIQDFLFLRRAEIQGVPPFLKASCDDQTAQFRYTDVPAVATAIADIALNL
ncbi:hypothetical protein SRS16P2_00463 (plasmid) [Variovorax sp. SRS16]|uniref:recombinase family protein n=1 Tax=Variovorax sp. SRS16 TaxID=282217 RepID=UPI0013175020|nr:recombinase family protein [Variovorax sp. SRS16]VTU46059.1 hypothetical protein SRS16P2_00463 [Variovorax sp. SRS16]